MRIAGLLSFHKLGGRDIERPLTETHPVSGIYYFSEVTVAVVFLIGSGPGNLIRSDRRAETDVNPTLLLDDSIDDTLCILAGLFLIGTGAPLYVNLYSFL